MNMEYNETKQKKKVLLINGKIFFNEPLVFFNSLKHYKVIMTSNTPLKAI